MKYKPSQLLLIAACALQLVAIPAVASRVLMPNSGKITEIDSGSKSLTINGEHFSVRSSAPVHLSNGSVQRFEQSELFSGSRIGYSLDPADGHTVTEVWVLPTSDTQQSDQ